MWVLRQMSVDELISLPDTFYGCASKGELVCNVLLYPLRI